MAPGQGSVIRGSGVDTKRFGLAAEPEGSIRIGCAARLLRSKGILVLAEAMRLLEPVAGLRLVLAGTPDPENEDSLTRHQVEAIAAQPNIEWIGRTEDMPRFWRDTHIGVLPSLTGEGLPVSLLEAASTGRAVVATDVSGCREIVQDGVTGLLVAAGDAAALAQALSKLANDAGLRHSYATAARRLVETELSAEHVGRQTIALYETLLDGR